MMLSSHDYSGICAGACDSKRIIEHGDAVKVTSLAEQFASPMHHRFDIFIPKFGRFLDTPLKRFVVVPNKLKVNAQVYCVHRFFGSFLSARNGRGELSPVFDMLAERFGWTGLGV